MRTKLPSLARWTLAVLLAVLGLAGSVVLVGGVAAMVYVGRDDTVPLVEQRLGTTGVALVTAPDLLGVRGPTVHVTATSPPTSPTSPTSPATSTPARATPIFLGVTPRYEADDYLAEAGRKEITAYRWRTGVSTADHPGRVPVTAPTTLDIWSVQQQGRGTATLSWTLPDGPYAIVVMRTDGRSLGTVAVSVGLQLPGLYATAAAIAAGGLLVVLLTVAGLLRLRLRRQEAGR